MRDVKLDDIVSLCKRRGFIYPGSDVYGGLSGTWDYGPLGVQLKRNIMQLWWKMFVDERDDMLGVDAAILMNQKVWQASGHTETFTDPLVECSNCHNRFRADKIDVSQCPTCGQKDTFGEPRQFNMMFETRIGPVDTALQPSAEEITNVEQKLAEQLPGGAIKKSMSYVIDNRVYLRPETAQGIFTNFKNVVDSFYPDVPFGLAQQGKA
ncbi:MAG: glycine--tRNA ligase, partial [Candidatus Saccharimonadales bacterium]